MVFVFTAYRPADPSLISGRLVRQIYDSEQRAPIYVHTVPLITSHNVVDGKLVEREDGTFAVALKLDRIGQDVWLQACKQLAGQEMVVVVDGFHLFNAKIPLRPESYEWMLVEGAWEKGQAQGVASHARTNYETLNPSPLQSLL
jgi:preprotein translocase subunit SecD